ncbi:MAG: SDR family NAD(P)-dependent oxidoreductase [Bacilli bacterium]|nr:SDR family NAD(P)-dependent oxidoreductase [Bacilli bacterium]
MKTVVVTGSARGFGLAMLKEFRKYNFNVVVTDINEEEIKKAKKTLEEIDSLGEIYTQVADVTSEEDITKLIKNTINKFDSIDIWINNAGVNQVMNPVWNLESTIIDRLIDIDLKGTINCSKLIMKAMIKQGFGTIYNVEGFGSNNQMHLGLTVYGTCKRGVTYFTDSLYKECTELKTNVRIGKITPGIMITNFINTALGDGEKFTLDDNTKKIYNMLGDYPETIAKFVVSKMIKNKKMNPHITWLNTFRVFKKMFKYLFYKNDFFKKDA